MRIHSYPKIYNMGHPAIKELFNEEVSISEKVDGSQISFSVQSDGLHIRSKSKELCLESPEKLFTKGVETIKNISHELYYNWVYRGEYLSKPKHNVLAYDRTPNNHIVIYDIETSPNDFLCLRELEDHCSKIGLEPIREYEHLKIRHPEELKEFLEHTSMFGGSKIEGIVAKNYNRFGIDGKVLMGKYVSEAFKEVHKAEWKKSNPTSKDILTTISDSYRSQARWNKAILHLLERGELANSPTDIGALIKEVKTDLEQEAEQEIKELLYKWAKDSILRRSVAGLAEWYKEKLLQEQFNGNV